MTSPKFECWQSWNRISVRSVLFFGCLSFGDVCVITHHQNLKPCFLCHHQLQVMCFCYRHQIQIQSFCIITKQVSCCFHIPSLFAILVSLEHHQIQVRLFLYNHQLHVLLFNTLTIIPNTAQMPTASAVVVAAVGCDVNVDAQCAILTGGREEGRDEDNRVGQWRW
jgi:hypothetical protein